MPPRRSHKKSRAGCLRCKQRKVKCDELHPVCGNCTKHGVTCDFDDPTAVSPVSTRHVSSGDDAVVKYTSRSPSASSSSTPMYTQPAETTMSHYSSTSRAMELRLLHNYTTFTSKTLAAVNTPATEAAWQVSVPNLAFSCPCLMDAILAVSALHLRSMQPQDTSLVRAFHGYMASSLSQYTQSLADGVNAFNAEALFTTSALIAFQASASRRFMNEDGMDEFGAEGYTLPVQWFHSFQGVKTVVLASWRWLRVSEQVRPIIQAQPALALDLKPSRAAFFGSLLDGLDEQLEGLSEPAKSETRQAYEHSVAYLNWAHQKPERSRILGFPATVSRRFIQLIGSQDSRALMIIASFFAMTRAVDDAWWLTGVAKKEVTGIMSLLPSECWPKLEWAVRVAHHDGALDEEVWGDCWHSGEQPNKEEGFGGDVSKHIDILARIDPDQLMGGAYSGIGTMEMDLAEMAMIDLD